jgi:multisubunit Na+/H+ antiporter MnhG subunit
VSATGIAVVVLLSLASVLTILCTVGLVTAKDIFDRMHYVGPVAVVAPLFLTVAILLEESFNSRGIKSIVITVAALVLQPALTHATARACRIREFGDWTLRSEERK